MSTYYIHAPMPNNTYHHNAIAQGHTAHQQQQQYVAYVVSYPFPSIPHQAVDSTERTATETMPTPKTYPICTQGMASTRTSPQNQKRYNGYRVPPPAQKRQQNMTTHSTPYSINFSSNMVHQAKADNPHSWTASTVMDVVGASPSATSLDRAVPPSPPRGHLDSTTPRMCAKARQLIEEVEWYLRDHTKAGSMSFIEVQRQVKDSVPTLVDAVLTHYDNSWHSLVANCGGETLDVFHYTRDEIQRLGLRQIADEHEARVRLCEFPKTSCEATDAEAAQKHAAIAGQAAAYAHQLLLEDPTGTIEVGALALRLASATIYGGVFCDYFDGISKSALKRLLSRTPSSPVWLSGNYVKIRRVAPSA